MDISVFNGIMICIPFVVSWIIIMIKEITFCNYYACMCIHFLYVSLCNTNVNDKLSVFSRWPYSSCHSFIINISFINLYLLIILLTYIFFVSNHHPLYFCISLTGLINFITHAIQYMSKQIS